MLHADGEKIQYFDKNFRETFCSVGNHPSTLKERVSAVNHCRKYMKENLVEAGSSAIRNRSDDISRLPVLQRWFKTGRAICLWLSDGCMQINWYEVSHIILLIMNHKQWSINSTFTVEHLEKAPHPPPVKHVVHAMYHFKYFN